MAQSKESLSAVNSAVKKLIRLVVGDLQSFVKRDGNFENPLLVLTRKEIESLSIWKYIGKDYIGKICGVEAKVEEKDGKELKISKFTNILPQTPTYFPWQKASVLLDYQLDGTRAQTEEKKIEIATLAMRELAKELVPSVLSEMNLALKKFVTENAKTDKQSIFNKIKNTLEESKGNTAKTNPINVSTSSESSRDINLGLEINYDLIDIEELDIIIKSLYKLSAIINIAKDEPKKTQRSPDTPDDDGITERTILYVLRDNLCYQISYTELPVMDERFKGFEDLILKANNIIYYSGDYNDLETSEINALFKDISDKIISLYPGLKEFLEEINAKIAKEYARFAPDNASAAVSASAHSDADVGTPRNMDFFTKMEGSDDPLFSAEELSKLKFKIFKDDYFDINQSNINKLKEFWSKFLNQKVFDFNDQPINKPLFDNLLKACGEVLPGLIVIPTINIVKNSDVHIFLSSFATFYELCLDCKKEKAEKSTTTLSGANAASAAQVGGLTPAGLPG